MKTDPPAVVLPETPGYWGGLRAEDETHPYADSVVCLAGSDWTLDPENARKHDRRNLDSIKASLEAHGQRTPIVLSSEGVVKKGNGTLIAASEMGWLYLWAVRSDLDGGEADAYALRDNRTAELADWDWAVLADHLRSFDEAGYDLPSLGWEAFESDPLLAADFSPPDSKPGDGTSGSGDDQGAGEDLPEAVVRVLDAVVVLVESWEGKRRRKAEERDLVDALEAWRTPE